MESIWSEMKDTVEELQDNLGMDFSQEIETIEREMENAEQPEESSGKVGRIIEQPKVAAIDSIFEALIQ